jgi:hypothetical protein
MYPMHYVYYALTVDDREREIRELGRAAAVRRALDEHEAPKPPNGPLRRGLARVAAGVSLGSASLASALDCDVAADLAEQFPR